MRPEEFIHEKPLVECPHCMSDMVYYGKASDRRNDILMQKCEACRHHWLCRPLDYMASIDELIDNIYSDTPPFEVEPVAIDDFVRTWPQLIWDWYISIMKSAGFAAAGYILARYLFP